MANAPNIVFLFPDQLRADFLGCYGADWLETPNIDRIAEQGVRFDNAFSTSPLCVPARTALLTGMNAVRNGVTSNIHNLRADYREAGLRTWPEILADGGYQTAAIGKMHFYPWDDERGFGYRSIAEDKRWLHVHDDYDQYLRERGLRKMHGNEFDGYHDRKGAVVSTIPREHSWDRFVGREARRYIRERSAGGPFAMMVGFPGPHCPYDPVAESLAGIDDSRIPAAAPSVPGQIPGLVEASNVANSLPWNGIDYNDFPDVAKQRIRAHYSALVVQIDHEVGEILDTLEEAGVLDDTLVVLSSDHGDYLGDHDLVGKGSFFEGAIRVPLVAMGPGIKAGQELDELVEARDVTPTLLAFAGRDIPAWYDAVPLPGAGMPGERGRDRIFGLLGDGWMHFDGRHKLHKYASGEVLLFDMSTDPHEQHDLSNDPDHQHLLRRLDAGLTAHVMASTQASWDDRLAFDGDLSQDPSFGERGWRRPWPHPPAAQGGWHPHRGELAQGLPARRVDLPAGRSRPAARVHRPGQVGRRLPGCLRTLREPDHRDGHAGGLHPRPAATPV